MNGSPSDRPTAPLSYEADGRAVAPAQFYAMACDPRRSVAVEACAGSGKTWLLVSRILRALLDQAAGEGGVQPQEILAITFTKKAAGEMRKRLYDWLEEFARASPEKLREELLERGIAPRVLDEMGSQPTKNMPELLSNLYQSLIDNGRMVQIRTFHSWFAALLRSAPLAVLHELELPSSYELLEDDSRATQLVWPRFYATLQGDAQALADYQALVAGHGRSQAGKALEAALDKRIEFTLADQAGVVAGSVPHFSQVFTEFAGLDMPDEMLGSNRDHRQKLRDAALALGAASAPTVSAKGVALEQACAEHNWQAAIEALFTKEETPRKFSEKIDGIERVRIAQDLLERILQARAQHAAWQHQQALMRLARVLLAEYAALKRERGWVDMPDLERAAQRMLADRTLGAWVQQRLDAHVRHLLIDEFQDTNPLQWQALSNWLASYAGAGGGERPGVFIVGDPKQSIYRFRRAEPQVFQAAQRFVTEGLGGTRLSCDHTRRNAPEVLSAVNAAMAQAQGEGLGDFRMHTTGSDTQGAVLRLRQIARLAKGGTGEDREHIWRDTLTEPHETAEDTLRTLEARQAARWIAGQLAAGSTPGSFMVLSRKRASLGLMHAELRALHISAAVAEKTGLMDCCEVQDVVALLDALVSPRHSLSLARALKSPLFGLSDDDLVGIALAARRVKSDLKEGESEPGWLHVLSKSELLTSNLRGLHAVLLQYQGWVASLPPHDALSLIFHHADAPARFAAAAPAAQRASVLANLGALVQATLALQGARYTTAYGLVRQLKAGSVQAPAQTPTEAVQLLTVHGAKGLEAPTVILLDTDAQATRAESVGVLVDWPGEAAHPRKFIFLASESNPPPSVRDTLAAEQLARDREEINALYVAMTRAQRRLVISSSEPHVADPRSWWQRLMPLAQPVEAPGEPEPPPPLPQHAEAPTGSFTLPDLPSFSRKAVAERSFPAMENEAEQIENENRGDADSSAQARIGQAMHRLLEWQSTGPASAGFAASRQQQRAVTREWGLTGGELERTLVLARNIREGQARWAWDESQVDWHGNEVELGYQGQLLRLDRLVQRPEGGAWWVLDYKSAHQPEQQAGLVAQMKRYRAAVQALHPGAVVELALLAGDGKMLVL